MFNIQKWDSLYLNRNENRIHFIRINNDKPPVILLHGAFDSGQCWAPIAKILAKDYDIIMPDARAHGLTRFSDDEMLTFHSMSDDIGFMIKKLKLDKLRIIGHSMGANVAALTAARYPEHISQIILEDPFFRLRNPTYIPKFLVKAIVNVLVRFLFTGDFKQLLEKGRKQNPAWSEEELIPWAKSKIQFKAQNPKKLQDLALTPYNWKQIIPKI